MMTQDFGVDSAANRACLAKARPGEPVFILLGRDPDGATLVSEWAARRAAACQRAEMDQTHARSAGGIAAAFAAYAADPRNAPDSAPPADAYPPTPADTYRLAQSVNDQLLLANLTVKILRTLALSKFKLVDGPPAAQAKAWLREYIDGEREGHGPLGSPMMWPTGLTAIEALLRGWGFQPTPTTPAYVAQVRQ